LILTTKSPTCASLGSTPMICTTPNPSIRSIKDPTEGVCSKPGLSNQRAIYWSKISGVVNSWVKLVPLDSDILLSCFYVESDDS
jgi:hypothetical protein